MVAVVMGGKGGTKMKIKTGFAIAAVVMGLGATSVAMDHGRGRDRDDDRRGNLRMASWHNGHDKDDQKGYEKGKKTGWQNGSLPPGQAKKESKKSMKEHKHEADWHRDEAREREREAREHRHRSHDVIVHKQPRPTTNAALAKRDATVRERAASVERARKEHKAEAQVNHK